MESLCIDLPRKLVLIVIFLIYLCIKFMKLNIIGITRNDIYMILIWFFACHLASCSLAHIK
jgi:hypothetical protein